MTTTDFYGATSDSHNILIGVTASYPTTSSTSGPGSTHLRVGQHVSAPNFFVYQSGLSFDTSAIGAGGNVSAATLSLYGQADESTTDFTVHALLYDWGATYDTTDLKTAAELNALTSLATFATSGMSTSGYNVFTDVAMAANINKTGVTSIVLASSRWMGSNTPSGTERVDFKSYDAGDPYRPKLTVTYTTTSIKSVSGVAQASIKSVAGVPIASVKSVAGVT